MARFVQTNFRNGEVTPKVYGRFDKDFYRNSAAKIENFIVTKWGGVKRRRGVQWLADSAAGVRLIPFNFNLADRGVLELRPEGLVFHTFVLEGEELVRRRFPESGVITPTGWNYTAGELAELDFVQINDQLTLVCSTKLPRTLTRTGDNSNWVLQDITYAPPVNAVSGIVEVKNNIDNARPDSQPDRESARYQITAVDKNGNESPLSNARRVEADLSASVSAATIDSSLYYRISKSIIADDFFALGAILTVSARVGTMDRATGDKGSVFSVIDTFSSLPSTPRGVSLTDSDSFYFFRADLGTAPTLEFFIERQITQKLSPNGMFEIDNSWDADWDNQITWEPVRPPSGQTANDISYIVYKWNYSQSVFGYLGETTSESGNPTSFRDDNIQEDTTRQPTEINLDPFNTDPEGVITDDSPKPNPTAITYFQQRQVMGATEQRPHGLWLSRTADYDNFNVSTPQQDDDAITLRIASQRLDAVTHFAPLQNLLIFTQGAEWFVPSENLTPEQVQIRIQSYYGSVDDKKLKPILTANQALFVQRGHRVRSMAFDDISQAYVGTEVSVLAEHLVGGDDPTHQLTSWDYAENVDNVIWATRGDGRLLGCSYLAEQEVIAWHSHTLTDAKFRQVVCLPTNEVEDETYFYIERGDGTFYIATFSDDYQDTFAADGEPQNYKSTLVTMPIETGLFDGGRSIGGSISARISPKEFFMAGDLRGTDAFKYGIAKLGTTPTEMWDGVTTATIDDSDVGGEVVVQDNLYNLFDYGVSNFSASRGQCLHMTYDGGEAFAIHTLLMTYELREPNTG